MGWFGLGVSSLEKKNPSALLENEQNHLREEIAKYNTALAHHAGNIASLGSRDKSLTIEHDDLTQKLNALITSGKTDLAGQVALKLQTNESTHATVKTSLDAANTQYNTLTKIRDASVKAAKDKLEAVAHNIDEMKLQKATAELTEMASGMVSSIGSSGDTLNRIAQQVEDEKNQAAGRVRVAQDSVDLDTAIELATSQTDTAAQALAAYQAKQGIPPIKTTVPSFNEQHAINIKIEN